MSFGWRRAPRDSPPSNNPPPIAIVSPPSKPKPHLPPRQRLLAQVRGTASTTAATVATAASAAPAAAPGSTDSARRHLRSAPSGVGSKIAENERFVTVAEHTTRGLNHSAASRASALAAASTPVPPLVRSGGTPASGAAFIRAGAVTISPVRSPLDSSVYNNRFVRYLRTQTAAPRSESAAEPARTQRSEWKRDDSDSGSGSGSESESETSPAADGNTLTRSSVSAPTGSMHPPPAAASQRTASEDADLRAALAFVDTELARARRHRKRHSTKPLSPWNQHFSVPIPLPTSELPPTGLSITTNVSAQHAEAAYAKAAAIEATARATAAAAAREKQRNRRAADLRNDNHVTARLQSPPQAASKVVAPKPQPVLPPPPAAVEETKSVAVPELPPKPLLALTAPAAQTPPQPSASTAGASAVKPTPHPSPPAASAIHPVRGKATVAFGTVVSVHPPPLSSAGGSPKQRLLRSPPNPSTARRSSIGASPGSVARHGNPPPIALPQGLTQRESTAIRLSTSERSDSPVLDWSVVAPPPPEPILIDVFQRREDEPMLYKPSFVVRETAPPSAESVLAEAAHHRRHLSNPIRFVGGDAPPLASIASGAASGAVSGAGDAASFASPPPSASPMREPEARLTSLLTEPAPTRLDSASPVFASTAAASSLSTALVVSDSPPPAMGKLDIVVPPPPAAAGSTALSTAATGDVVPSSASLLPLAMPTASKLRAMAGLWRAREVIRRKLVAMRASASAKHAIVREAEIADWMESRSKSVIRAATREQQQRCRDLFHVLDINGNEMVEEEELMAALLALQAGSSRAVQLSQLQSDATSHKRAIDFEEFVNKFHDVSTWESLFATLEQRRNRSREIEHNRLAARARAFHHAPSGPIPPPPPFEKFLVHRSRLHGGGSGRPHTARPFSTADGLAFHTLMSPNRPGGNKPPQSHVRATQQKVLSAIEQHNERASSGLATASAAAAAHPVVASHDPASVIDPKTSRAMVRRASIDQYHSDQRQLESHAANERKREISLPFMLWVPAYHRLRVMEDLTDPSRVQQRLAVMNAERQRAAATKRWNGDEPEAPEVKAERESGKVDVSIRYERPPVLVRKRSFLKRGHRDRFLALKKQREEELKISSDPTATAADAANPLLASTQYLSQNRALTARAIATIRIREQARGQFRSADHEIIRRDGTHHSDPSILTSPGTRDIFGLREIRKAVNERRRWKPKPKKRKYRPIRLHDTDQMDGETADGATALVPIDPLLSAAATALSAAGAVATAAASASASAAPSPLPSARSRGRAALLARSDQAVSHSVRRAREQIVRKALEEEPLTAIWASTQQQVVASRAAAIEHHNPDDVRARLEQHIDNREWRLRQGFKPLLFDGDRL